MDWHKLQHTLFEIEPTDRNADLAKLTGAANSSVEAAPTKDYVKESVEVAPGSMPLGIDSVADFAALAGVRIDETRAGKPGEQSRHGGKMPKAKPGRTNHPDTGKLVGEEDNDSILQKGYKLATKGALAPDSFEKKVKDVVGGSGKPNKAAPTTKADPALAKKKAVSWKGFLQQHTKQLQQIAGDPAKKQAFDQFMAKIGEAQETPKPRDPSSKDLDALRRSGAGGAHKQKKKVLPRKEKHKGKAYESSIKEMLLRKLNEKNERT
jgi:hypothetical protein